MQLIIPMSGQGIRFKNAGYKEPKPFIIVDSKPIIQHVVEMFPPMNTTFIINEHHVEYSDLLKSIVNPNFECNIIVIKEHKLGPVYALKEMFEHPDFNDFNDNTIVSYCDFSSYFSYESFLSLINNENPDGVIFAYKGFHPHMLGTDNYAFIKSNETDFLEIQEKKPFTNNRMEEFASNGIYYFKKGLLKKYVLKQIEQNIKTNNEYYVSMTYNLLHQDSLKIKIFPIQYMLQWGTPKDLEEYISWSNYFSKIINPIQISTNPPGTYTILPFAGAGSRFSMKGYTIPKPLININGYPMIIQAIKQIPQSDNNIFICLNEHKDIISPELTKFYPNCIIKSIPSVTEGQACTCMIGIENTVTNDSPIMISACDNGIYFNQLEYSTLLNDKNIDIIVFTFNGSSHSSSYRNPQMYSWIVKDSDNYVNNVLVKNNYSKLCPTNSTECIIGTMFFRKCKYFTDSFKETVSKNIRTNNEFYVDNVLNECILSGLKIKTICVEDYICWGTPDDYETYIYWQSYFNLNKNHPYSIDKDTTNNIN